MADTEVVNIEKKEIEEFNKWLMGGSTEPPEIMQKMTANFIYKLNLLMGSVIVKSYMRLVKFDQYLGEIEDELFDTSEIVSLDRDALLELHSNARRSQMEILEFMRKFIYQNRENSLFKPYEVGADKIQSLLSSLPTDKQAEIEKVLLDAIAKAK